jgi:hypothetical protein
LSDLSDFKHLSDTLAMQNGMKHGNALSPLFFNFALHYAIRMVRVNQEGNETGWKLQLLIYAANVSLLNYNTRTGKTDKMFMLLQ